MLITLNPLPETATTPINVIQRVGLELEDIEREFTVTETFNTVNEYNAFALTPQVFVIE